MQQSALKFGLIMIQLKGRGERQGRLGRIFVDTALLFPLRPWIGDSDILVVIAEESE